MTHVPQFIFICLAMFDLGVALGYHGKPRPPWSFWTYAAGWVVMTALVYAGGFFNGVF